MTLLPEKESDRFQFQRLSCLDEISIRLLTFPITLKGTGIIIFFQFWAALVSAQLPSGTWISSHKLRVGTYFEPEGVSVEMMTVFKRRYLQEDSVYSEGGDILYFADSGKAELLKDIRGSAMENLFGSPDSTMVFGTDTFHLKFLDESKMILNRQFTDSIWHETHFCRIPKSKLTRRDSSAFYPRSGGHLLLSVDDSVPGTYRLDFLNERRLVITGIADGMKYSCRGTWHSRRVGETLFFAFYDGHFNMFRLFYFNGLSANGLVGGTYGNAAMLKSAPKEQPSKMTVLDTLAESERTEIEKSLTGSWQASNDPLFYDPAIEFGFLSFQNFEITLGADGKFEMHKSGTVLKHGDSIPIEENQEGVWELGPTGDYVVLNVEEDPPQYLSIERLEEGVLDVSYFMKTLSEFPNYNVHENRRVELRK